jgi:hypothetical protein
MQIFEAQQASGFIDAITIVVCLDRSPETIHF